MPARREVATSHRREVERSDHQWLLLVFAVFAAGLLTFGGALWIYHATGPHPKVTLALRQLKRLAKWILPGV